MPISKGIRVKLGFSKKSHPDFYAFLLVIIKGCLGNVYFSNPPIDMIKFQDLTASYRDKMIACLDGSKIAIAQRNSLRQTLEGMAQQLGLYVQHESNNDYAKFKTSGFENTATSYETPKHLSAPQPPKLSHGDVSGAIKAKVPPSYRKVINFYFRHGPADDIPNAEQWPVQPITMLDRPTVISNLTPGVLYAFQIRALNRLGQSDWSQFALLRCL